MVVDDDEFCRDAEEAPYAHHSTGNEVLVVEGADHDAYIRTEVLPCTGLERLDVVSASVDQSGLQGFDLLKQLGLPVEELLDSRLRHRRLRPRRCGRAC